MVTRSWGSGPARRPWALVLAGLTASALVAGGLAGGGGPPVIRLVAAGAATEAGMATEADASAEADRARGALAWSPAELDFELTDAARLSADERTAYRLEPPHDPREAAATLAARLGVRGEVEAAPGDVLRVGAPDGTGARLWVDVVGQWGFDGPGGAAEVVCVEPAVPDVTEPARPEVTEPSQPADGGDDRADPDEPVADRSMDEIPPFEPPPCEPPEPPTGVPDGAEARRAAESLVAGLDPTGPPRATDVRADDWGARVVGGVEIDGVLTDLRWSVAFGQDATVTSATGTLARPVAVDAYPTVDADAAVKRLGDGRMAGTLPLGEPGGAPLPEIDPPEPEPRTVTLVGAEPALLWTVDADGVAWLLPGVRFLDADGGQWPVITVADDYLDLGDDSSVSGPGGEPEPAPEPPAGGGEPGLDPGDDPDHGIEPGFDGDQVDPRAREVADAVVGLPEDDAVARIEESGLVARVVERDGRTFDVTMDLRGDRINLRVADDEVVEAKVG